MEHEILDLIDRYWKFDNDQTPVSNWHDKQDLLEAVGKALRKTDVTCCGVFERMQLGWMKLENGTRCMPYIKGHSDEIMYRVNNCPSCGKYVRDVMVEP
jgi:hypothetical protein